ncbi:MAG: DNA repair protein RecN [Bacteroidales bacterium]|nr:DNA repair protein RecN [Bacteroidales bacterium]
MLCSLSVSNYILIGSLETRFPEGLIIISGETGAGKSILLGALSLVLGAKADASMVGPHGENCVVEAEFSVDAALRAFLEEKDIPLEGDTLVLRRVVSKSGRSRCFASDEPVAVGDLQEMSALLVDIHSQHQTLQLQDVRFRTEALDLFAGSTELRERTAAAQKQWQAQARALEELRARKALALRDQEYNHARWQRLEEARLVSGELEELEAEQKRLSHAEEIKELLFAAQTVLEEMRPKEASKLLDKASRFIPSLGDLCSRLESARLELEDIGAEVETLNARTEASPERLQQVEERLSLLYGLMQKYGAASLEELMAERDKLAVLVQDVSSIEEEEAALEVSVRLARQAYDALHEQLLEERRTAAVPFGQAIQKRLQELELEGAVFTVSVDGDAVNFLFSSTGKVPADVAKAASGGELSRIMLSLKATMAQYKRMPTLVFDEIDSGVSGSTADKMGSLVCEMGRNMQVFAITHLPQVAAKGSAHFLVSREGDLTSVRALDGDGRVQELARMLSGSVITQAAVANAKALLAQ